MPLNTQFRVKNDLNTLGRILSGGTDILSIFSPSNTSYTVAGNTGTNFNVAGGQTLTLSGSNIVVNTVLGTRTAGFSIAALGVGNNELAGGISDSKLATISTAGKVANSATTATDLNASSAIVARDASGNFSAGTITAAVVNATTGFRVNGAATSGNVLRGNGTNFVASTLAASDIVSGRALTAGNDTNVTLTLSGAASVALLSAASITAGWTGQLSQARGGTGNTTGQAASVANAVTFNNGGTGDVSGTAFNGLAARTISHNTIGASPLAGSTSLTTVGTIGSGTWNGSTIGIGFGGTGATTQQAAINALVGGAGTGGRYLRSNGTNVALTAIQAGDVPTLNQNTTGSAATLSSSRSIWGQSFNGSGDVTGNLSNVGNITGNGAITIQTASNGSITFTPNGTGTVTTSAPLIATGTFSANTTNQNVNIGAATGTGVTTISSGALGSINNLSIGDRAASTGRFTNLTSTGNLTVGGNLTVVGSATYISTNNLIVEDPIIFLGEGNTSDTVDIGFTGAYNHSVTPLSGRHTGLIRDFGDKKWTLFSGLTAEVLSSVNINFNDPSIVIDTLRANIEGNVVGSVTGNASTATALQNPRNFSLGTGDVTSPTVSFNGSGNVALNTTIANNAVTFAKFQQLPPNSVVGNPTALSGNAIPIPTSATGLALLSATNAAAGATTLGLGVTNSVTHNDLTLGGNSPKVNNAVYTGSVTGGQTLTVPTFSKTAYRTGRYTVQIRNTATNARAALDIIATNNGALASWDGTVFGIIDTSNMLNLLDVDITGATVGLHFTFMGSGDYAVTILSTAIAD